jgi:hypothetical protein
MVGANYIVYFVYSRSRSSRARGQPSFNSRDIARSARSRPLMLLLNVTFKVENVIG